MTWAELKKQVEEKMAAEHQDEDSPVMIYMGQPNYLISLDRLLEVKIDYGAVMLHIG